MPADKMAGASATNVLRMLSMTVALVHPVLSAWRARCRISTGKVHDLARVRTMRNACPWRFAPGSKEEITR